MEAASLDVLPKRVSVLKMDTPAEKLLLVLQLCNTHQVIHPDVVKQVTVPEQVGFTPREREIFSLLVDPSYTQRDIAGLLHISESTMNTHATSINKKLRIPGGRLHLIQRYSTKP